MKKMVLLDRDGVINIESKDYIKSPDEWHPISGSLEAIARLKKAGFVVCVVTNQSGVARGLFSQETLDKIHDKLHNELRRLDGSVDAILYCPHHPDEACHCRKPSPGLLEQAAHRFQVDLRGVIMVGDSLKDIQAATKVGATPLLVETGNGKKTAEHQDDVNGIDVFDDLRHAVDWILEDK